MSSARVDYIAPWWTYWLHNFPHINLRFQPIENRFQPEEENYQQSNTMCRSAGPGPYDFLSCFLLCDPSQIPSQSIATWASGPHTHPAMRLLILSKQPGFNISLVIRSVSLTKAGMREKKYICSVCFSCDVFVFQYFGVSPRRAASGLLLMFGSASLIFLGCVAAAGLGLNLLCLAIYLSCLCCCRKDEEEESKKPNSCCVTWSSGVAVGVGFYGNSETNDGVYQLTYSLYNANHTLGGVDSLVAIQPCVTMATSGQAETLCDLLSKSRD
ncbi:hypothetical protein INR49_027265 [Caranx melampygus]|nr:hypothetical protein INR49_027265 [Caranx melampygus]